MRFLQLHRTYAACLLAALALGASCTKTVYDEGQQTQSPAISLSVTEAAQTRALVDPSNFGTAGNRIQVYDFWTDGITESKYIDAYAGPEVSSDSPQHVTGTTWPFVNKTTGALETYNWTNTGVHKFFGWYAKDAQLSATADAFFGSGFSFNESSKVLSIPAKDLSGDCLQYDFLYSSISSHDMAAGIPQNGHVNLSFSHLFSAVSFGAKKQTSSDVRILEFSVDNIPYRSATISFSGTEPSVSYQDNGSWSSTTFKKAGAETYTAAGLEFPTAVAGQDPQINDLLFNYQSGTKNYQQQNFSLTWPLGKDVLHSSESVTEDGEANPVYPASYKMYIKYSVDGVIFEKRLNFPEQEWEAGKKYHYWIVFADKMVQLKCVVNPWDYVEQEVDFSDNIMMKDGGQIAWDATKSNVEYPYVYIKDGQPAEGSFTFDAPEGGRWIATLEGDVDAFTLIDGEGEINGTAATVKVAPAITNPVRDYKVTLRFVVRKADGTTLDADDFVQPAGKKYTIVLQKN